MSTRSLGCQNVYVIQYNHDWHCQGQRLTVNLTLVAQKYSLKQQQMIASNFYRFEYNIKACEKLSGQLRLIKNGTNKNALIEDRKAKWSIFRQNDPFSDRGLVYKNIRRFYQKQQSANKKPEENGEAFKVYTKDKIKSTLFDWAERLVKENCTKVSFEECQHNAEQDRLHKFLLSCSIFIYSGVRLPDGYFIRIPQGAV